MVDLKVERRAPAAFLFLIIADCVIHETVRTAVQCRREAIFMALRKAIVSLREHFHSIALDGSLNGS